MRIKYLKEAHSKYTTIKFNQASIYLLNLAKFQQSGNEVGKYIDQKCQQLEPSLCHLIDVSIQKISNKTSNAIIHKNERS